MLKPIICTCAAVSAIFIAQSCGGEKKAAEKLQEALVNAALPDGAKADIDGQQITITDGDGNRTEIGGASWPQGELASAIPTFTGGKQDSSVVTAEACMITFSQVGTKEAEAYLASVRAHGFNQDVAEFTVNTNRGFQAANDKGQSVMVNYDSASQNLVIGINRKDTAQ